MKGSSQPLAKVIRPAQFTHRHMDERLVDGHVQDLRSGESLLAARLGRVSGAQRVERAEDGLGRQLRETGQHYFSRPGRGMFPQRAPNLSAAFQSE